MSKLLPKVFLIYIHKSISQLNRGRGINLFGNIDEFKNIINVSERQTIDSTVQQ